MLFEEEEIFLLELVGFSIVYYDNLESCADLYGGLFARIVFGSVFYYRDEHIVA